MAAFKAAGESMANPLEYSENNILGSINLISSAVKNKVKKIIFSSTAAVYGEPQYNPINEKHPLQGQSPNSASKIASDQLAISRIAHLVSTVLQNEQNELLYSSQKK